MAGDSFPHNGVVGAHRLREEDKILQPCAARRAEESLKCLPQGPNDGGPQLLRSGFLSVINCSPLVPSAALP